jgi:SAM-dependent methyltransferase
MEQSPETSEVPEGSQLYGGRGDFHAIGREFLGHFVNLAQLHRDERVLDLGCGMGRMARPLTRYLSAAGQYWGLDVGKPAIAWCQAHLTSAHPNFHFQHLDERSGLYNPEGRLLPKELRLPFPDGVFDFVFLTSVFTHLLPDAAERYLAEVDRVLKPDGRCLATFFLVNDATRPLLDREGNPIRFPIAREGSWISTEEILEAAVALPEDSIRRWIQATEMRVVEPIRYGSWSSAYPEPFSFQDVVLFGKPGWRPGSLERPPTVMGRSPSYLPRRIARSAEVDLERVGEEVVLMHLTSLELRFLNETGAILWDAMEEIQEPTELVELLVEARPEFSRETHEANVSLFLQELVGAGFLIIESTEPDTAG